MRINPYYLINKEKIKKTFQKEGIVQLTNFLEEESYLALKKQLKGLKYKKHYNPESYYYSKSRIKVSSQLGIFLADITSKEKLSLECLKLTKRNYVLLHATIKETHPVEIVLNVTDDENLEGGGKVVYTKGKGDYYKLPSIKNSLSLVKKGRVHRFISYVNHKAMSTRYILLGKLR